MFDDDWSPEVRAKETARLRQNLYYGPPLERVPVPPEVEIEILDNPRYVRVGHRFGFTLLYGYPDGTSQVHFCDRGPYLPRAERPAAARVQYPQEELDDYREMHGEELVRPTVEELPITDREYYEWLEGQDDASRHRGIAVMHAIHSNVSPERYPVMDMRFWLANQDPVPDPVLTIRCHAMRRKRPCRKLIAKIWRTEYGLYGVAHYAPSTELRRVIVMAEDEDYLRRLDAGAEYDFALGRDVIEGIGVAMACPDHGNGAVDTALILEAANDPKRRTLNVDVLEGQTRVHWR